MFPPKPKGKQNSNAHSRTPAQIHRYKIRSTNIIELIYKVTHCLAEAAVKGARLNVNLFVPVKKIFIDFVNSKLVLAPTL